MGEVCTDAACAGPDLGKERGHQGDMFSPLTVTDPWTDSPQSICEELWAAGQLDGLWSQSQVLRNSATNSTQKEGKCLIWMQYMIAL